MRILHVTEALGGGVAHSISQLACRQSQDGIAVTIAHSVRDDTPRGDALDLLFPSSITRVVVPMVTAVSPVADLASLVALVRLIRRLKPDIVHLHSSKAGVLGRVASWLLGLQSRTYYSPRGFSFLRQDVSERKRNLFLAFERIAARLGGTIIACSATEAEFARSSVRARRVALVENCVDTTAVTPVTLRCGSPVRVVTSGRICYPKAPWRFRRLAEACASPSTRFVWIGDGELRHELEMNDGSCSGLEVLGWLSRGQVYEELSRSDIFVLPSLWEGMPLALIEAQVAGLPAVVSDVVGCRDVIVDGVTGFVCRSDAELAARLKLLIEDLELRRRMSSAARDQALRRFSIERAHHEMLAVYAESCQYAPVR